MANATSCGHIVWDTIRNNRDSLIALHETRAPAWVPETEIRGTFSILLTCLVTLAACVYSAIHLNVPLETGFWHTIIRKTLWVVVALVAPEYVVMTAMLQFHAAWTTLSELQRLQNDTAEDRVDKKFVFDLKYTFFIVMGGVRVHTSTLAMFLTPGEIEEVVDIHNGFGGQPADRPVWQLTPMGLLDLARLGHWLYISPQRISDRSKADGLQKSLVLLQVSWMMASCVARKAYGLPLTLLEIHTMVHVVCAFVMYALWFKKPTDIRDPEILDIYDGRIDDMAYLCQRSLPRDKPLRFPPRHSEGEVEENTSTCECGEMRVVFDPNLGQEVYDADKDLLRHQRWHAAVRATQAVDPTRDHIQCYENKQTAFRPRHAFVDNYSSGADVEVSETGNLAAWAAALNLCVVPILYGGIHLTAWASEFPSGVERLLWRGSSISIMLTLLAWPWIVVLLDFSSQVRKDWLRNVSLFKDRDRVRNVIMWAVTVPVTLVLWLAVSAVLLASVLGRFYLVIEAFISLRAVPVGVYWVPSWLKYIPHV